MFAKFITSGNGMLRKVLDNDTTTRNTISLNGLGVTKGQSTSVYVMLKTGMVLSEDHTIFNYGTTILHKGLKYKDRKVVVRPRVNKTPTFVILGNDKGISVQENFPYEFIMDNLDISLFTTVNEDFGNASTAILERFIKTRSSK